MICRSIFCQYLPGIRFISSLNVVKRTEENVVKLFEETLQQKSNVDTQTIVPWAVESGARAFIKKKKMKKKKPKKATDVTYFVPSNSEAFSYFDHLHSKLKLRLNSMYKKAFPVQESVLPLALKRRSILLQSETGSGKTLAYVIPVVNALLNSGLSSDNICLVLAPSKELCDQIYRVFLSVVPKTSSVIMLDSKTGPLLNRQLVDGIPIIISTPGFVNAKLKEGLIKLSNVRIMVVDECDRMYQEDFQDQILHMIATVASKKKPRAQFLISSATISAGMKGFMKEHVPDIAILETGIVNPTTLLHKCVVSPVQRRTETLLHLLSSNTDDGGNSLKTIIFVQRKAICSSLNEVLQEAGYYSTMLNGDMSEGQREMVFKSFKEGQYDILIATDIVARGIDVPDCELTIQIQPRVDVDMYFHRAGRAARAGRQGTSYIITCEGDTYDREMVHEIRQVVDVEFVDAYSILPKEESGVASMLENSLQNVTKSDELAFSLDITMTEQLRFYQKLVTDMGIRPISILHVKEKSIYGLWFCSPLEAWAARSTIQQYFKSNNMALPNMGVFQHKHRNKRVPDWGGYFSDMRKQIREEREQRYHNLVKQQMGAKRSKQGRRKWKFSPQFIS